MSIPPMERLRAVAAGTSRLAPATTAFGIQLDDVEPGKIVARIPVVPPSWLRGAGAAFVLADVACTTSITSTFETPMRLSTLTLHVTELTPPPRPGSTVVAIGRAVQVDGDRAVSTAELSVGGQPYAHVVGRCGVLTAGPEWGRLSGALDAPVVGFADLDPDLDPGGEPGVTTAVAAPSCSNTGGALHGGVVAAIVGDALDGLLAHERPRLADAPTEYDVTFVRGLTADGATVRAEATIVHGGSRFASARAELHDAAGRLCVTATAARWRG